MDTQTPNPEKKNPRISRHHSRKEKGKEKKRRKKNWRCVNNHISRKATHYSVQQQGTRLPFTRNQSPVKLANAASNYVWCFPRIISAGISQQRCFSVGSVISTWQWMSTMNSQLVRLIRRATNSKTRSILEPQSSTDWCQTQRQLRSPLYGRYSCSIRYLAQRNSCSIIFLAT